MSPDTIAAVATANEGSARGIVRLSGERVLDVVQRCFHAREPIQLGDARFPSAFLGHVVLKESAIELPCRLYFWPTQRSYPGEPSAELHTLGSPPLLEAVVSTLCQAGSRPARPGEFTLRAFLSGRIDLTQAEAVLGVIDAHGDDALRAALNQLAGGLGIPLRRLRDELLDLLAQLEAGLDFVEEDIEFITRGQLEAQLASALQGVSSIARSLDVRDQSIDLPTVVLAGPPNAGKSSLFNALARDGQALVADQPGTTRDYLTARLELDGAACDLIDTAGIDEASTKGISTLAQRAAERFQAQADVVLWCVDSSRAGDPTAPIGMQCLVVWTKSDTVPSDQTRVERGGIATSAATGDGLPELRDAIRLAIRELAPGDGEGVRATAARCRAALDAATAALDSARLLCREEAGDELIAAEVRAAIDQLGEVVGAVYTEDLLDRVFSRFCIGK